MRTSDSNQMPTTPANSQDAVLSPVRKCICPKCKGKKLQFTELWKNHAVGFYYVDGQLSQAWISEGEPYKVQAKCMNCKHEWTLRGIIQVSDLEGYIS